MSGRRRRRARAVGCQGQSGPNQSQCRGCDRAGGHAVTATVFEHLYSMDVPPPWDMEGPAPFVVDLEAAGRFRGDVLDVGCGTGENALYLASRGLRVVGVD